jgi:sigma-B regulation protein RsbU (phosphoserine phosphatase)
VHAVTTDGTDIEQLRRRLAAVEQELDAYRGRLQRQLSLAAEVHRSLLPTPVRDERVLIDVRYVPIDEVGGDYCQVHFPDPEMCYVAMCDVTGHGIGPALLATRVSSEIRYGMVYGRPPRDILRWLNRFIYRDFYEANLYLSCVVAQIDLPRRRITYSGAGHPSPLLVRRNGATVEPLASQNPLVGVLQDMLADEPEHTVELESGDRLVFYTDGLTETVGEDGRQLGTAGLAEIAVDARDVGLFEMADHVLDRVARYDVGPITDDRTLIVAEIQ